MSYVGYVIDTETTGTNPDLHDIIEICLWRIGDAESRTWWTKPLKPENIEDEALRINNHKKEDILHKTKEGVDKYRDPAIVLPEIEMWLMEDGCAAEDRLFIGQNPKFDYDFGLKLWENSGNLDDFPFGYWIEDKNGNKKNISAIIDTIQIVRLIDFCTGKKRDKYGLGALVKAFSITKAQSHRADGDVKMTKELFEKVISVIKNPIIDNFSNSY